MPATHEERPVRRSMALAAVFVAAMALPPSWRDAPPSAQEPSRKPPAGEAASGTNTGEGPRKPGPSASKPTPAATPRRPATAPQVMSRAAADAKRPRSSFLLPPGYATSPQDRYNGEEIDWAELPAWRQTSFFGIHARGQFFIYVVDRSGSMIDDDRLVRAKIELRRSIYGLQPPQRFEVIFYDDEATPMPGGPTPRSADQRNKDQLTSWLRLIDPDGGTEPKVAVLQALSLRPDAVFLLSDGDFPDGTIEAIAHANSKKVPIHCVDLAGGLAGDHLKRIARDSGGVYASRPGSLHANP
ncbi:hypothetical protein OJF2_66330 [Aquisphaera giovannonii]|uniref:VWFA domain-containing protein n=1 Tax=Aquisphaera giovannonii TaxID=406548 RepID=A0A5B9WBZ5_9BACT|nr:magnesium chelatase [Aquisphaera giovannonii]QEH38037.1 hypothetical protein OJF2_66330 [Aquisphaera giovannonii]